MNQRRLDYDDSIRRLRELGFLGTEECPPMPDHVPQPEDDEPLGLRRRLISDQLQLQQTAAAMLVSRGSVSHSAAAAAELHRFGGGILLIGCVTERLPALGLSNG